MPRLLRVLGRLTQRLIAPTRRGGWPWISASDHRVAVAIWLRFLLTDQYFGRTHLYQSFEPLGLPGVRPSEARARVYGFEELIRPGARVLDIGCNMGCMSLQAARFAREVVGIEVDPDLLWIAERLRHYSGRQNVRFLHMPFDQFEEADRFDVVLAFAVHRWIGMPFARFAARMADLLRPGGVLLFESNNYSMVADEFEGEVKVLEANGFAALRSGITEFETTRKFYALERAAGAPSP